MRFFFIFLTLISIAISVRADEPPQFSDASQRMMEVDLDDGSSISASMPLHSSQNRWYVPLGELAHGLGLEIDAIPEQETAEGFVIDRKRVFLLSLKICKAKHDGIEEGFDCTEAVAFDDDIYVTTQLAARLLPIRIAVDPFRSQVKIEAKQKLPAQLRDERDKPPDAPRRSGSYDPGYPRRDIHREQLDGAMIDQQIGVVTERVDLDRTSRLTHDTLFAGEIFGMDASALVGGTESRIERQRYTLLRRDPEGGMLGALHARDIQLLDALFPSVPLIGGGGLYRGALISSFPLQSPTQFGTQDFVGDLPGGWEVEIFQNDILIDRAISLGGRYEFLAIPLLYGDNRFRLVFYGPQGQRREQLETYSIDSSFLRPGDSAYRFAFGDAPSAYTRWLMQYDKSLSKAFTVSTALSRIPVGLELPISYGLLGVRAFTKDVLLTANAAASETGGQALDTAVQVPFMQTAVGAGYTRLNKFRSEVFALLPGRTPRDVIRANSTFNLFNAPTVRFTLEAARTFYEEGFDTMAHTVRTSVQTGPVQWFHTLTYDDNAGGLKGELAPQTIVYGFDARTVFTYDDRAAISAALELRKRFTDELSAVAGWQELWRDQLRKFYGSLNREFEDVTFSANAAFESKGNFVVGALVSYSFGRDPRTGWHVGPKPQASFGAASLCVFLDLNQNGVRDLGEPPLKNIGIKLNQQDSGRLTDDEGNLLLTGLDPYEPLDIAVRERTFAEPFRRPKPRGVRFVPRPGKTIPIDLPVIVASDLSGFVAVASGQVLRPRRGLTLELRDASGKLLRTTRTASDGYYLFDGLNAGSYTVSVEPRVLRILNLRGEPSAHAFEITPEGVKGEGDFTLVPK